MTTRTIRGLHSTRGRAAILLAFALAASGLQAGTYYVNRATGLDGEGRGSAELPYQSIQAAITNAENDSTILIAPGIYDNGFGIDEKNCTNRIVIAGKQLVLKANGSGEVVILGAGDANSPYEKRPDSGIGPGAIRCAYVYDASQTKPVIFDGITFRDGHCSSTNNSTVGFAGGLYANNAYTYAVNCTFEDCVGERGGAMYNGTAVRCLFRRNQGYTKAAVAYIGRLFNCVAVRNASVSGAMVVQSKCVNCTFEDNFGNIAAEKNSLLLNCVSLRQTGTIGDRNDSASSPTLGHVVCTNCVFGTASTSKTACTFHPDSADCITNATAYQCVAPALEDVRPCAGAQILTAGKGELLSVFPIGSETTYDAIRPDIDFEGNVISASGTIAAGAYQQGVTPKGGLIVFEPPVKLEGHAAGYMTSDYAHAVDYPTQWKVDANVEGKTLYGFYFTGNPIAAFKWQYPQMDGLFWTMPPSLGNIITNSVKYAVTNLYVNPVSGSDAVLADGAARGTESAPFKTLQAALDAAPSGESNRSVVYAAEGTYEEGGAIAQDATNRVACKKAVRLLGKGVGCSIIRGALDTTSDDRSADGRGDAAMRCVYVSYGCVQGFTLTDGRSAWKGGTTDAIYSTRAGGAYVNGGVLSDCLITNCIAYRGGASSHGLIVRTRFADCVGGNGVTRDGTCVSCVFEPMPNTSAALIGAMMKVYQTTGVMTFDGATVFSTDSGTIATNCVLRNGGCGGIGKKVGVGGSLVSGFATYSTEANVGDYVVDDPCFVDEANGDYRLLTVSQGLQSGVFTETSWQTYQSDFNGNPLTFIDGKPIAGAFQIPVQAVVVNKGAAGDVFTCVGTNALAAGQSLTVTAGDTTRHAIGLSVNGVATNVTSVTFTAPAADVIPTETLGGTFAALYSTNWYVNPARFGLAGNDGFTPETAHGSFSNLFESCDIRAGDCVHAAEGRYEEGTMGGAVYTRSRLCIPKNVTVVADGDVEKTFIIGAPAPADQNPNEYGLGTNAVRCVYMNGSTRLVGFTLTGGHTGAINVDDTENGGGGVAGESTSSVWDCIITNNAAVRGGGGRSGRYTNCRFFNNVATKNRAAIGSAYAYGCVFDYNRGANAVQNCFDTINCTFGAHNYTLDGVTLTPGCTYPMTTVYNCLFLGSYEKHASYGFHAENCVFVTKYSNEAYTYTNCVFATAEDLQLDADYRPVVGSCAAIDAGSNDVAQTCAYLSDRDCLGGQRIYNGTIDAGALEGDWRARYATDLGGGVTVGAASPDVVESATRAVVISNGTLEVAFAPAPGTHRRTYGFTATAAGEGSFAATLNGAALEPTATAEGVSTYKFRNNRVNNALTFSFVPTAEGSSVALSGFSAVSPGFILLVK